MATNDFQKKRFADDIPALNGQREIPSREGESERRRFAKAIARSEFGRHYWDDKFETELREARTRRRKKGRD